MMATHSVHLLCFLSILLSQFHVSYASDVNNGHNLKAEVKLLSLQLFQLPDSRLLATLNVFSNSCVTLGDYSACQVYGGDTHRSQLRVLVTDLQAEEGRRYKCTANVVDGYGFPEVLTWILTVRGIGEYQGSLSVSG
ncbi:hypothetical protein ACOMHN_058941 [Nucella lapillus]